MMSLDVIVALNEEIAAEAAQNDLVPFVPDGPESVDRWPPFPIPNIGYHKPDGWKRTDQEWFVDKSGFGRPGEPALTVEQLKRELRSYIARHPGHGFAITEEGEFQLYISAFRPKAERKR